MGAKPNEPMLLARVNQSRTPVVTFPSLRPTETTVQTLTPLRPSPHSHTRPLEADDLVDLVSQHLSPRERFISRAFVWLASPTTLILLVQSAPTDEDAERLLHRTDRRRLPLPRMQAVGMAHTGRSRLWSARSARASG